MEKLIKIQNELKVPKGNYNSFGKYKYRSCEDILEAVKPLLSKHQSTLTLTDDIVLIGSKVFLKSTATFNDGKTDKSVNGFAETSEHKGMSAEQTTGTASSYARKYALNGLFLIDETESDADHDNKQQAPTKQIDIEGVKANLIVAGNLTELKSLWSKLSKDEQASKEIIDFTNNLKSKLK